jgi:hypothetical protein
MKKTSGEEPVRVIIHIYMEMSQGNSLRSYLKQTKMSFFFSFTKSENRCRTGPAVAGREGWIGARGRGKVIGKVYKMVNMVQILCTHICNCKSDSGDRVKGQHLRR